MFSMAYPLHHTCHTGLHPVTLLDMLNEHTSAIFPHEFPNQIPMSHFIANYTHNAPYYSALVTPNVCNTFPNISYFVKIMFGNV